MQTLGTCTCGGCTRDAGVTSAQTGLW